MEVKIRSFKKFDLTLETEHELATIYWCLGRLDGAAEFFNKSGSWGMARKIRKDLYDKGLMDLQRAKDILGIEEEL